MESIETLIPDREGNYLVVVLSFYDRSDKTETFQIPPEFGDLDIADISIAKIELDKPLHLRAFHGMCRWLIEQFKIFPNAVFSFICSTDPLETHHTDIDPQEYRWDLFEYFYRRNREELNCMGVSAKDIIVGPEGFQTFAKVFYRETHAPIIHLVVDHLVNKY